MLIYQIGEDVIIKENLFITESIILRKKLDEVRKKINLTDDDLSKINEIFYKIDNDQLIKKKNY